MTQHPSILVQMAGVLAKRLAKVQAAQTMASLNPPSVEKETEKA